MQRAVILAILFLVPLQAWSQEDPLQGRWEGSVRTPGGDRNVTATFKKMESGYTGSISGISGTTELVFKEVRREGNSVKALLEIDSPRGPLTIQFDFTLSGESLDGKAEIELGTQKLAFDYNLRRAGDLLVRKEADPVEKLKYFEGDWSFEMDARESPLGPGGSIAGRQSVRRVLGGQFLQNTVEARVEGMALRVVGYMGYDPSASNYTYFESPPAGPAMMSVGTWVGPAIRLESAPVHIAGQQVRLKRILSIHSDTSFTVREEFSVDGRPFQLLGKGMFTKIH